MANPLAGLPPRLLQLQSRFQPLQRPPLARVGGETNPIASRIKHQLQIEIEMGEAMPDHAARLRMRGGKGA